MGFVRVTGAREHNLRGVDVEFPRDELVVVTGVSGSGKSSLAFGTVYAEAQRRYLESVSPYARRLLNQVGAPKVDQITGLPPAVAFGQQRAVPGSRSSVGTVTTLSNLLRMLYSRAGDYPPGAPRVDSDAFSPNTPAGACPECHGQGLLHRVTEDSLVPDPSLSIRDRAIAAWPGAWLGKNFRDILATLGYDVDRPWAELSQQDRDWILFTDEQPVVTVHPEREVGRIQRPYQGRYQSAERYVLHTFATSKSLPIRQRMRRFLRTSPCPVCHGRRLQPSSLAVTYAGLSIADMIALPLRDLGAVLRERPPTTEPAATIVPDLLARIDLLVELGLGYLSVDRSTPTLSAGELQRLRLATQLRSGLFGVVYVLDEPSAGLHPADTEPLLTLLARLQAAGNSLLLVEHDLQVIRTAAWLIDVGPGAGTHGGEVLYSGPVAGLAAVEASATARFLFHGQSLVDSVERKPTGWLRLTGIDRHNLRDLSVEFPLGVFTAVTGVSGSGKSTLVSQVLADVVAGHLRADEEPSEETDDDSLEESVDASIGVTATGVEQLDRLVRVDQRPIGRTPRSNLATYTGLFDAVRKVFAGTPTAKERGYTAGRFSFNVAGGRCETCQGEGFVAVELLFLPGTYQPCPTCHGARYNAATLEVTYRDKTIADVLDLTVDEAAEFLADVPAAARSLGVLREVGLGYLHLGQPATELSGGEAQRIKLAAELQRGRRGRTLYLLDEPTTGLHPADVEVLTRQLHSLVDQGHTVIVVEHDLAVIAGADWVVDLGPGGGSDGGRIVATGPPAAVAVAPDSRTAPYLAAVLAHLP